MQRPLRNLIADHVVAALHGAGARRKLDELAAALRGDEVPADAAAHLIASGVFEAVSAPPRRLRLAAAYAAELEAAAQRVVTAQAAVERYWCRPAAATGDPVTTALARAAVLFDAALFFEVHEILEAVWRDLEGPARGYVQGVIQIAVALHHFEAGNAAGARTLFAEGRAKVAPFAPAAYGLRVDALLDGLAPWQRAADAGRWPEAIALPPFVVDGPA
jgi:uncharacterized protein